MANKKNKPAIPGSNRAGKPVQGRPQQAPPQKIVEGNIFRRPQVQAIIAAGIALVTWLFLKVCLNNQLTNWDDPGYIKDNALIKDISSEGIKNIFSTPIMGNYHPLTILSYAIEYSYVRLEPWLYHLDSLLFHIATTLLVYWFVILLTRRPVAAAITALLFGLHPMHMESVAWLAGRKDVVYGLFYMAACIAYLNYLRTAWNKRWGWYGAVVVLFVCSLLAKPVAVILPVTLFLVDYFERRGLFKLNVTGTGNPVDVLGTAGNSKINCSLFADKIILFSISVGFGLKSLVDQKVFGALGTQDVHFNFAERVALGAYALVTYLWKAVAPTGLSCFYPYPDKVNGALPGIYYTYPIAVAAAIFLAWYFLRKNRVIVFGLLFFLVNIALLLQFIPVGGAIIADRYSYIPYMGLFFIAGWLVSGFFEPGGKKELGYAALSITLVYTLFLGYLGNERCQAWYDTTSLWRDEIEKQPNAPNAFNNLGFNYFNKFNESVKQDERKIYFDSSYYLLNKAIELQHDFANPYVSLGELHRSIGKFPEARNYYYKALSLKDKVGSANAYLGLAIIYAISQNFDSSAFCFRAAIQRKAYFPEAHSNFGNYFDMTHQTDSALKEYGIAIAQNPDMYAPHLNRGRLLQRAKRNDEAIKDFEIALQLNPDMGEIYYARSFCYTAKGDKARAVQDVDKAISLGFKNIDNAYYTMLKSR